MNKLSSIISLMGFWKHSLDLELLLPNSSKGKFQNENIKHKLVKTCIFFRSTGIWGINAPFFNYGDSRKEHYRRNELMKLCWKFLYCNWIFGPVVEFIEYEIVSSSIQSHNLQKWFCSLIHVNSMRMIFRCLWPPD